jgi:hypothetical protein
MLRHKRAEEIRLHSVQRELARAEEDYQRLRSAYLDLATREHGNEVALAMVGADMDRAHAAMQALAGLPPLPYTHEPTRVVRREARRMAEHDS